MRFYHILSIVTVIAISCNTLPTDNAELQDLAEADQMDRRTHHKNISVNDRSRLSRVKEIIAADSLKTSNDYFNAAIILQHSENLNDFPIATELARKSVKMNSDNPDAKRLIAQSTDRYLTNQNKPQIYGTQRHTFGEMEYLFPIDLDAATDEERNELEVRTIPELLALFNKKHGKQLTNIEDYYFTDSLMRVYYPEVRAEMIGLFDDLIAQVNYPEDARKNNISGKVRVEYTIEIDGSVTNAMVVDGLGYGCDEEALRVIKLAKYKNLMGVPIERRTPIPFGLE